MIVVMVVIAAVIAGVLLAVTERAIRGARVEARDPYQTEMRRVRANLLEKI